VSTQSHSGRFVTGENAALPIEYGVVWAARFEEEQSFLSAPDIETKFLGLPPRSLVTMWNNLSQLGPAYPRSSENKL
jgi:hypothetical protein